jgi:hypothetical protein
MVRPVWFRCRQIQLVYVHFCVAPPTTTAAPGSWETTRWSRCTALATFPTSQASTCEQARHGQSNGADRVGVAGDGTRHLRPRLQFDRGHVVTALTEAGVHLVYGDNVWPLHRPRSSPEKQLPWSATRSAIEYSIAEP